MYTIWCWKIGCLHTIIWLIIFKRLKHWFLHDNLALTIRWSICDKCNSYESVIPRKQNTCSGYIANCLFFIFAFIANVLREIGSVEKRKTIRSLRASTGLCLPAESRNVSGEEWHHNSVHIPMMEEQYRARHTQRTAHSRTISFIHAHGQMGMGYMHEFGASPSMPSNGSECFAWVCVCVCVCVHGDATNIFFCLIKLREFYVNLVNHFQNI